MKGIDNSLFIDDDGTAYLLFVNFNEGNEIWMAELQSDLLHIKPGTEQFIIRMSQEWEEVWPSVNEGPFIVKHAGAGGLIVFQFEMIFSHQRAEMVYSNPSGEFDDCPDVKR